MKGESNPIIYMQCILHQCISSCVSFKTLTTYISHSNNNNAFVSVKVKQVAFIDIQ